MLMRFALFAPVLGLGAASACAATIGPPMFDITHQCNASTHHNETAMSECVVAESEARADMLQNWAKYSEESAERCIKAGRKARRLPYTVMSKCLAAANASVATPTPVAAGKQ